MTTKKLIIQLSLISSLIAGLSLLIFWHHHKTKDNYPIHTVYSYDEALHITHSTDKNTFVFFDVDDTVLSSPALNKNYFSWWFKLLFLLSHPTHLFMNWKKAYSQLWTQTPFTLTQPSVVQLITTLKEQGATVLGLTSMESGTYGIIKNMPEWRYSMLKNLGIEFSQHFPDAQFQNFPQY